MQYLYTKRAVLAIFYLLFLTIGLYSQQWVRRTGFNSDDRAFGIVTDRAGNIYTAGYVTTGTGEDMCLTKYNSEGAQQWQRYYNGPGSGDDRALGIAVDNNSNIIITGYSKGVGSGTDFTTIKYTPNGAQQWVSRYNEPGNGDDKAFGIVVDRIGNIYVTGSIARVGTDIYTIKYNTNGVYIWGQLISGTANEDDQAFGIAVDSIGNNVYLCGYTDNDTTGIDFTVAAYDSSGGIRWINKYNGSEGGTDKAWGIVVDDNKIIVTGESDGDTSRGDCMTIKYSAQGDTQWTARYNGAGNHNDKAFGIVVDADGNSYIAGYSVGEDTSTTDYLTVKYGLEGEMLWDNTYNGTGHYQDTAFGICLPKSSEYVYVTGGSSSDTVRGKMDAVSIRYNIFSGNESQVSRYNGTDNLNDAALGITVDTSGNIFVTGYTQTIAAGYDMLAMKYQGGELIAVNIISTEVPKSFSLSQNYPNPFNPTTTIKFDVQKTAFVKLRIYDILGREVALLVNETLRVGKYEALFSSSRLASGIYFYELSAEGFTDTKKMMLIK
jgi:uncharacterized delta-60 repeat protein